MGIISNSIVLSACLFGSVYIFAKSLALMNNAYLIQDKVISNNLIMINGVTCVIAGSIFLYSVASKK